MVIDSKVKQITQSILNRRLNRTVIIDETRAHGDKSIIMVKLHNIKDKMDLLYNKRGPLK